MFHRRGSRNVLASFLHMYEIFSTRNRRKEFLFYFSVFGRSHACMHTRRTWSSTNEEPRNATDELIIPKCLKSHTFENDRWILCVFFFKAFVSFSFHSFHFASFHDCGDLVVRARLREHVMLAIKELFYSPELWINTSKYNTHFEYKNNEHYKLFILCVRERFSFSFSSFFSRVHFTMFDMCLDRMAWINAREEFNREHTSTTFFACFFLVRFANCSVCSLFRSRLISLFFARIYWNGKVRKKSRNEYRKWIPSRICCWRSRETRNTRFARTRHVAMNFSFSFLIRSFLWLQCKRCRNFSIPNLTMTMTTTAIDTFRHFGISVFGLVMSWTVVDKRFLFMSRFR